MQLRGETISYGGHNCLVLRTYEQVNSVCCATYHGNISSEA